MRLTLEVVVAVPSALLRTGALLFVIVLLLVMPLAPRTPTAVAVPVMGTRAAVVVVAAVVDVRDAEAIGGFDATVGDAMLVDEIVGVGVPVLATEVPVAVTSGLELGIVGAAVAVAVGAAVSGADVTLAVVAAGAVVTVTAPVSRPLVITGCASE